jgi:hypothetical protein
MTSARHLTLLVLGLLGLLFVFAGCDSDDLDDRNPGVIVENDVRVFTFTLNDQDRGEFRFGRTFSTDSSEVQYDTDEEFYPQLASLLTERTVDEGIVLLYVSDVLNENGLRRSGWTPLPLALGFDVDSPTGNDPDGFVDYVLTTTYTFDIDRLFVNLVASDTATIGFLQDTQEFLSNLEDIRFRLVAIPGGGFNRGIDYSDYEAVARAYNLPD